MYSKQIFVFLFFVLAASVGWLMNKLSADYLRTVPYRIEFYNSKDLRHIFEVETDVIAQINMNGFLATRYNFAEQNIIRIDLSDKYFSPTKKFVLASDIFQKVSEQLGDGKKLAGLTPDTIFFTYNELQSKRLPVIPNLDLNFASEYMQCGNILLTPDSVWVSAEQSVLNSITEIQCIPQKYENINKTISGVLDLQTKGLKDVSIQQGKINFKVVVERYSEATITVPLQLVNRPDNLDVMLFPREIEIKYRASTADFAKIKANYFRLTADFNDFRKSLNGNLPVKIETKPESVLQIDLYPNFVELIVNKK